MKTISMIGIAVALCMPALAAAQRGGGGAVAVQRVQVQRMDVQRVGRIDATRTINPARDIDIRRGNAFAGETGTRIRHRDDDPNRHDPARRRWNAAHPSEPDPSHLARRRWNAAHPSEPDPSLSNAGR
jgi:hypothetical protein